MKIFLYLSMWVFNYFLYITKKIGTSIVALVVKCGCPEDMKVFFVIFLLFLLITNTVVVIVYQIAWWMIIVGAVVSFPLVLFAVIFGDLIGKISPM